MIVVLLLFVMDYHTLRILFDLLCEYEPKQPKPLDQPGLPAAADQSGKAPGLNPQLRKIQGLMVILRLSSSILDGFFVTFERSFRPRPLTSDQCLDMIRELETSKEGFQALFKESPPELGREPSSLPS